MIHCERPRVQQKHARYQQGSKMDIIIRIKAAALKDVKNIRKFFIENMGSFGRMVFVFLPARSCLLPKIFVTI